jgi:signal transduction histidine kinase/ligand-binding sensor domain-containing protein
MTLKRLFGISVCFIFSGCWFSNRQIPLPPEEAEYPPPVQKPLIFSDPVPVKWTTVPADSIHPGQISPFDLSKLPSQDFNPAAFSALSKPAVQRPFNYATLPDTVMDLDKIPAEPLVYKTSLIGVPKKVKLDLPRLRAESYFTSFQYSEVQGIPGMTVQSVLHTKDGLTWIGTEGGLCVIEGESLEIFPYKYGTIFNMAEDKEGRIWIRTGDNGVFEIDRKTGIQKQIELPFGVHIRIDLKGYIWICTFNYGISLISPDHKTFQHISIENGLGSNRSLRTLEDNDGRIWIGNLQSGLDILDLKENKIKRMGIAQGLSGNNVFSMAANNKGDIYIGGYNNGVDIINIGQNTFRYVEAINGEKKYRFYNMLSDDEGRLWIGTDSAGVYILNKNNDSVSHLSTPQGLGDSLTRCLSMNSQHQMYVGTYMGGMNVFPPGNVVAHHISTTDGLLNKEVWGLLEDDKDRKWIATHAGLNILMPDEKILKFQPDRRGTNRFDPVIKTGPDEILTGGFETGLYLINVARKTSEHIGIREGLPGVEISNLFQDKRGLIWIATYNGIVTQFDLLKRTIHYFQIPGGPDSNRITGFTDDGSGKLWIATYNGLFILKTTENTISRYSKQNGLSSDLCDMILADSKNRIWVSTEKGLNLLDQAKNNNTIFSESNGLAASGSYSLMEKGGRIFAGTSKGLTILKETKSLTVSENIWNLQTYSRLQGFKYVDFNANTQMSTLSGELWWGIEDGITMMNNSLFKDDSSVVSPKITGIELFGKVQYFTDPGMIKGTDTIWSENLDSFYLKGTFNSLNKEKQKGIEWDSLSNTYFPVNLSLPFNQNYIRFHFSNMLPQDAGQYKYRYILDGVDEKWSPVTSTPITENYNNISPGNYTLRISARRNLGPWSEPSVYHFRIRPPWWYSWWAELIYLFIFIGLLRFWVRYRSRRLQKENMILEQKITDRTTALSTSLENLRQAQGQLIQAEKMASLGELTAGIAHEIQNPLNFVNNFSEVNTELIDDVNKALEQGDVPEAKEILKDLEMNMGKITFHGKRADAIVKGMLLHSRASSGQKIPTDVNALADEYLRLSYHGLRARDKSFNAQFTMDLDEKLEDIMLVQQDIGRVFLNLFNNAFYSVTEKKKLAPESYEPTVSLSTKKKPDAVEIRIRDNGVGIPKKLLDKIYQPFFTTKPAGQGTGLGLSLSYDIITKEHGGKIDVETKENEFTEFIIELPIQA